jgi:hypothetical protein
MLIDKMFFALLTFKFRYPILDVADPEIAHQLREAGLPPFFALSWFITWFAHNVSELHVSRNVVFNVLLLS